MMTIPDLLKAKNLALKSSKLKVEVIRLKSQVEEAFNSELIFDISLKEIPPETSSNETSLENKPFDYRPPSMFSFNDNMLKRVTDMVSGTIEVTTLKSSLPNIRVEGSEAALLVTCTS